MCDCKLKGQQGPDLKKRESRPFSWNQAFRIHGIRFYAVEKGGHLRTEQPGGGPEDKKEGYYMEYERKKR